MYLPLLVLDFKLHLLPVSEKNLMVDNACLLLTEWWKIHVILGMQND